MVYSLNIKKGYKKIENFDYLTKNAPEINKQLMLDMLKKMPILNMENATILTRLPPLQIIRKWFPFRFMMTMPPILNG